ncbi:MULTISPECIES: hypothetical protein [unclassified Bradyrhizobium]|nr:MULTISPECIES: hypothetical protein [unclassified Bradyrhizobium]MCK7667216.1 hypothetical protein [Bradyrhizobium sp. 2S1]QIG97708.1 hypothetical protein G6P99_38735 [Bradyrhizobium sp. 6(2017)]
MSRLQDGTGYVALSLTAENQEFKRLESFGGLVNFNAETIGLGGAFIRQ